MTTERVPVGVVGVGRMGAIHARTYARLKGVELVGVVDANAERAAAVAEETGSRAFSTLAELAEQVRAVSIAVPTSEHAVVARELIDYGVAVLVEKPLAAGLEEARALVAHAEAAGVALMVGHTERFNPVIRSVESLVDRPGFVEVHRLAPFTDRGTDVDVVLDLMIHDLDLLLRFVPSDVEQVDAVGVPVLTPRADIANARIRFASGTVANLTASRVSMERLRKVRFFQRDLYVSLDTGRRSASAYRLIRDGAQPRIEAVTIGPPPEEEPVEAELMAFVEAVVRGEEPPVTGQQGVRALELAERVRDAIRVDDGGA